MQRPHLMRAPPLKSITHNWDSHCIQRSLKKVVWTTALVQVAWRHVNHIKISPHSPYFTLLLFSADGPSWWTVWPWQVFFWFILAFGLPWFTVLVLVSCVCVVYLSCNFRSVFAFLISRTLFVFIAFWYCVILKFHQFAIYPASTGLRVRLMCE